MLRVLTWFRCPSQNNNVLSQKLHLKLMMAIWHANTNLIPKSSSEKKNASENTESVYLLTKSSYDRDTKKTTAITTGKWTTDNRKFEKNRLQTDKSIILWSLFFNEREAINLRHWRITFIPLHMLTNHFTSYTKIDGFFIRKIKIICCFVSSN